MSLGTLENKLKLNIPLNCLFSNLGDIYLGSLNHLLQVLVRISHSKASKASPEKAIVSLKSFSQVLRLVPLYAPISLASLLVTQAETVNDNFSL